MSHYQGRNKIQHLEQKIKEAASAYYNAQPVISDEEFDALCDQLRALAPGSAVLQQVGAPPVSPLQKIKHEIPMLSLGKVKTQQEFDGWVSGTGATKFVVEEKLDGISVELVYSNGMLRYALTRGDGETGENISHSVVQMKNVFAELPGFTGSLRGEIILRKSLFEENFSEYANTRNTVSGLARKLEIDQRLKFLEIVYYDLYAEQGFSTEKKKLQKIESMGCSVVANHVCTDVAGWYEDYADCRGELDYDIDGLVIKVNDVSLQEELGVVGGRPKGQIAWKFPSLQARTKLRGVQWQVGLTGRITPVAILEPVELGGVTISRTSLHNLHNFRQLKLTGCSEVLLSRRNDVIPYIEAAFASEGTAYTIPAKCPACGGAAQEIGDFLVCPSPQCSAKLVNDLTKWVEVVGLKDLGEAFLKDITQKLSVQTIADLYKLTIEQLLTLPGYKQTKAEKLITRIQNSKLLPFETFMAALNIPGIGKSTWVDVQQSGFTLDTLLQESPVLSERLQAVPNVGAITAQAIVAGLKNCRGVVRDLLAVGVSIQQKTGPLQGMSFCLTGSLPSGMSRGVAHKIVEKQGGVIKTSVSKGLTYLIQANPQSTSTKSQKARALGTKVIGEDEFLELAQFSTSMLESIAENK